MSLPTIDDFNNHYEETFQKEIVTRRKLKELQKWNKLSLKTKIKRLEDELKNNIKYLQTKFYYDRDLIEKGGHPELGFEDNYTTHLVDWAFEHSVKMRNKRLKKFGKKVNI
tara:strand:+ start:190 stop:522 length:333 start_codon:yes stop_codon:yes gene_type:complete